MSAFRSTGEALGEINNSQDPQSRQSRNPINDNIQLQPQQRSRTRSPTKSAFSKFRSKSRDPSPEKAPKKQKSSTNLASLLSRPKSLKGFNKVSVNDLVKELEGRDKENITPHEVQYQAPTPIFAQFTSDESFKAEQKRASADEARRSGEQNLHTKTRPEVKQRPKSFQVQAYQGKNPLTQGRSGSAEQKSNERGRSRFVNPFTGNSHGRSKSTTSVPMMAGSGERELNADEIDKHLEAMLDRRNIPENQRYKMRDLNDIIKMEFIRQDWAEMQAAKPDGRAENEEEKKRSRGKSFTFSRGRKEGKDGKDGSSTKKNKGESTIGRHFRSKSTESIAIERPTSSGSSASTSLFNKLKAQQSPSDYVSYLRKVQKPELVEVGKLHKLRLLLRNETVAWIEEFIQQGGMAEIVGLLQRIMNVEWR